MTTQVTPRIRVTDEMIDRYLCDKHGLQGPSVGYWTSAAMDRARKRLEASLGSQFVERRQSERRARVQEWIVGPRIKFEDSVGLNHRDKSSPDVETCGAAVEGVSKGKVIGVAATLASTDSGAGGADGQLPPARHLAQVSGAAVEGRLYCIDCHNKSGCATKSKGTGVCPYGPFDRNPSVSDTPNTTQAHQAKGINGGPTLRGNHRD